MPARNLWIVGFIMMVVSGCDREFGRPLTLNVLYDNANSAGFQTANRTISFEFPRDHGEHQDFQTEWWYVVGVVRDANAREFGFQFTLFRQAVTPTSNNANPWRNGQVYMAHFAISDIEAREHVAFERFSRGHDRLAGVTIEPFKAFLENWTLHATRTDFSPLILRTQADGYMIDLMLEASKPPVLHGDNGWSKKSPTNASYYYSVPRLKTSGTLTMPDGTFEVVGNAWFDHEWSTGILDANYRGWNWLALHLEDGRELVLFNLIPQNDRIESQPVGMLVHRDGSRRRLHSTEWNLQPTRYWGDWPVGWHLNIEGRTLVIDAAFDKQLMSTSVRYWEGVVFAQEKGQRVGDGYLELTGY